MFGKPKQPAEPRVLVRGSFLVTGVASVNNEYSWQRCWITGVLTGPGVAPVALLYQTRAHSDKWPELGQSLPVTLDAGTIVEIIWAEVPDPKQVGLERAQTIVDGMTKR